MGADTAGRALLKYHNVSQCIVSPQATLYQNLPATSTLLLLVFWQSREPHRTGLFMPLSAIPQHYSRPYMRAFQ